MKMKTILCTALAVLLVLSCLVGCQSTETPRASDEKPTATAPSDPTPTETNPASPASAVPLAAITNAKALGFSAFDNQLVEFLKQAGRADENFTVSPLSFKAALAMAVLGAEGETQTQLLDALGYRDVNQLRAWYATVLQGVDDFDAFFDDMEALYSEFSGSPKEERTAAYRVVNSVWSNKDLPGDFRPAFLDDVRKTCHAEAGSAPAAELADAVNAWVKEQTNGLIPAILSDASNYSAILVNALYLKSGWESGFRKLGDQPFTTASGQSVQKPFMNQCADLDYYKDEQTQLVRVPLQGGVSMIFVLGDDTGLADKLGKAENKLVDVTVPMFDVETTLNQKELVDYLKLVGCGKMFSADAEFGPMYERRLFVDDIIQKAKVHIDEEGLEAAAVTAIMMLEACVEPEPETPEIFCADRPFSFYIVTDGAAPELLFWGQIVN